MIKRHPKALVVEHHPGGSFCRVRHIKTDLLHGYRLTDLGGGQKASVATPEKALLDLVHLQPGGDAPDYLRELRLQNLDRLDLDELRRAAAFVAELARSGAQEYETL